MKNFINWLEEKKSDVMPQATTIVSAPLRGASQDQSGMGTRGSAADYTISDDTKQQTNLGGGKGPIGGKYGMPTGTTNKVTQAMKTRNDKMSAKKSMREDLATSSLMNLGAAIMGVLEAKNLSPKQKKIAALAGDRDKIDAADFKALRSKKMEEDVDLDEAFKSAFKLGDKVTIHNPGSSLHGKEGIVDKIHRGIPGSKKRYYTVYHGERSYQFPKENLRIVEEEVKLDEAIKLGSKVRIHNPGKRNHGEEGTVGEIHRGLPGVRPKYYTVDHGGTSSQLPKENIKIVKEEVELDEANMMSIEKGEKVRLTNPRAPARHTVTKIKGQNVHTINDSGEESVTPLSRVKSVKYQAQQLTKEEVESLEEGRPKKNVTAEDPGGEHPIAQLRKIVSMRGQVPFKHVNPKQKSNIDVKTAHQLLSKHDNMKTSGEKLEFASRIHKSPEEMQSVIRGEPAKKVPKVSLAGKITGTQSE